MATKAIVSDAQSVSEELENFRALQARLLAGARNRIHADIQRAIELGVIDEHGNVLSKEWHTGRQTGFRRVIDPAEGVHRRGTSRQRQIPSLPY